MLQHYYATERPLPTGRLLYRLLRAHSKTERDAIDSVTRQFWSSTEEGLINGRATKEIIKADEQRAFNREVGKLGGRPKKADAEVDPETRPVIETEPERLRNGNRSGSKNITDQEPNPDTRLQTKEKTKKPDLRSGKEKRAARFPTDFEITDSHRKKAAELGLNLQHEFEKFRDDALSKGKKFEVWSLAFSNWLRRANDFNGARSQAPIDWDALEKTAREREEANAH